MSRIAVRHARQSKIQKSKTEIDYFFSLSFEAFSFPSRSCSSSNFALFLFLSDYFRSCGSSLSFRCNSLFLNHRRYH